MNLLKKLSESMQGNRSFSGGAVAIKNKSLARIICEGVEEINDTIKEISEDEAKATDTIVNVIVNADNPAEVIQSMEDDGGEVQVQNESAMIIKESVGSWFSGLWEKIKAFFKKIKEFVKKVFAKVKFIFDSFFASNKNLVSRYGSKVDKDYDVEIQGILIKDLPNDIEESETLDTLKYFIKTFTDIIKDHVGSWNKKPYRNKNGERLGGIAFTQASPEESEEAFKIPDNDDLKNKLDKAVGNKDQFYAKVFSQLDNGKTYNKTSLSELQVQYRENHSKTTTKQVIKPADLGGHSEIKKMMTDGDSIIKNIESTRRNIENALNNIEKDMIDNDVFKGADRDDKVSSALKSYLAAAFKKSINFVGETVKALNSYIKIWTRLKKEQLYLCRQMFIKMYYKATGKQIANNSTDGEVMEDVEGAVDASDDEFLADATPADPEVPVEDANTTNASEEEDI